MHWSKSPNWQAIGFRFTSAVRINGSERNASGERLSGSARGSRAGERVLAIANFCRVHLTAPGIARNKRLFRRDAETSTRAACAPQKFANPH